MSDTHQFKPEDQVQHAFSYIGGDFLVLGLRNDRKYQTPGKPAVLEACVFFVEVPDGFPQSQWTKVSVNILETAMPSHKLPENFFYVKNWGENEELYTLMVEHGLLKPTGTTTPSGHVDVPLCELTEKGIHWCRVTMAILKCQ